MAKAPSAFRTISEVSEEIGVPQHVLRFWETKFAQLKPMKRGGGRRYYRPEDIALLRAVNGLLYTDGLTIRGVQKLLRERGARAVAAGDVGVGPAANSGPAASSSAAAPRNAAGKATKNGETGTGTAPETAASDTAETPLPFGAAPAPPTVHASLLQDLHAIRARLATALDTARAA